MVKKPVNMWTNPSDRPEPFGTCGQAMDNASTRYPQLDHTLWPFAHIFTGSTTILFLRGEDGAYAPLMV